MSEDLLLRDTAAEIARRCPGHHDGCWKALTETGFAALRDAGDDGVPMASAAQAALVVTELSKVVCGAPLVGALIAGEALRLAGATLDEPATIVLTDDLATLGSARAWDTTSAGTAIALDDGELVAVALGDQVPGADLTRGIATAGGPLRRLGAAADPRGTENFARLLLTADLLGAAEGLFTRAVDYAKQRVQFGQAIGSFQAVQHLLARAFAEVEAMRSTLAHAARALDTGDDPHAAVLVAKAYASEAAVSVVEAAIQVFGGVAITWEFPAHLHLRRVVADAAVLGSAERLYDELEGAPR